MTTEQIATATEAELQQRAEHLLAVSYWQQGSAAVHAADEELTAIADELQRRRATVTGVTP